MLIIICWMLFGISESSQKFQLSILEELIRLGFPHKVSDRLTFSILEELRAKWPVNHATEGRVTESKIYET